MVATGHAMPQWQQRCCGWACWHSSFCNNRIWHAPVRSLLAEQVLNGWNWKLNNYIIEQRQSHPHFAASDCSQLKTELDRLRTELLALQNENGQLRRVASNRDFRPIEDNLFLLQKVLHTACIAKVIFNWQPPEDGSKVEPDGLDLRKVDPLVVAAERRLNGQLYSSEHEFARRQLQNSIWELYLRLNSDDVAQRLGTERDSIKRQVPQLGKTSIHVRSSTVHASPCPITFLFSCGSGRRMA